MRKRGTVLLALLLILLGSYLLLAQLELGLPSWRVVWPVLPLAGGVALLIGPLFDPESDPDQVFLGTAAVLTSLVFFFITLGPLTYGSLGEWWPVFVLIGGVAFLTQWIAAGFRDWDALFLGLVALSVGAAASAIALQLLGPRTREILPRLWPIILILGGLIALLRGLLSSRSP
jgi:hypothetical protein